MDDIPKLTITVTVYETEEDMRIGNNAVATRKADNPPEFDRILKALNDPQLYLAFTGRSGVRLKSAGVARHLLETQHDGVEGEEVRIATVWKGREGMRFTYYAIQRTSDGKFLVSGNIWMANRYYPDVRLWDSWDSEGVDAFVQEHRLQVVK